MGQGEFRIVGDHLAIAVGARHQIDVEGPRTPFLIAHPLIVVLQLLGTVQPAVRIERLIVGDDDGIEEGLLLDTTPCGSLEHR